MNSCIALLFRSARNESGNTGILFGSTIVILMLAAGGAVDVTRAVTAQRALQDAADSAVIQAAALPRQTSPDDRINSAKLNFAANISRTQFANLAPDVSVNGTTVHLTVDTVIATTLLNIAHLEELPVRVRASAQTTPVGGPVCLLALDPASTDGVHVQGTGDIEYDACWAQTNSSAATAINSNGNSATAKGLGHCAVGNFSDAHAVFSPAPTAGCARLADPFAATEAYPTASAYRPSFAVPPLPDRCEANNLNLKKGVYQLNPGRYCGGMNIAAQANVTFNPGIYVIDNGAFNVQSGATAQGSNLLFHFRGADAHLQIIGGGVVDLHGRSTGSSYANFLFIADADAWTGKKSNIQGGGVFHLEGILYMPTQTLLVTGDGDVNSSADHFSMIAKDFSFQGNGRFRLATSGAMPEVLLQSNVRLTE